MTNQAYSVDKDLEKAIDCGLLIAHNRATFNPQLNAYVTEYSIKLDRKGQEYKLVNHLKKYGMVSNTRKDRFSFIPYEYIRIWCDTYNTIDYIKGLRHEHIVYVDLNDHHVTELESILSRLGRSWSRVECSSDKYFAPIHTCSSTSNHVYKISEAIHHAVSQNRYLAIGLLKTQSVYVPLPNTTVSNVSSNNLTAQSILESYKSAQRMYYQTENVGLDTFKWGEYK